MRHAAPGLLLSFLLGLAACASAQEPKAEVSLREQAFGAENRGDFSTAADAFLKLVAAEPDNPSWVVSAGDCLGRSGRFADAIDLLDGGRKKFPGVIEVPAMLARTLLLQSERDAGALNPDGLRAEAATIAEEVLQLNPDHEDTRLVLAQARYMLGEWDEAVRQAEEAARRHPRRAGAHILRGRIATDRMVDLMRMHDTGALTGQELADLVGSIDRERKTAKAEFTLAAELDPNRAHPHVMLARVAMFDKKDADARRHLLDALAIDPDVAIDHAQITRGLDWQAQAETYAAVRRRYEARADAAPAKAATLRWYEGRALFEGGHWQEAKSAFEEVLANNPSATNSYYYAMLAAYELGDHDAAQRHGAAYAAVSALAFADVVRNLGGDARGQTAAVIKFLADRAYAAGQVEQSRDLNHVTALLYDTAVTWNNHAFLCRETGQFAAALDSYQRALQKEPKSPQLLNDTGVVLQYHLANPVNLERARKLYEQAVECAAAVLADAAATAADKQAAQQAQADAKKNLAALQ